VDADGLNSLARLDSWWKHGGHLILTPHPGEMSRLTGLPVADIQSNRLEVCRRFAGTWGQVVILKGAGTIIASPDGRVSINPTGGPNLATAGAGDVLSGIIGGLLAQGLPPWEAAVSGVYWHGLAGDILRREHGDAGTLAGDLPPVLPRARRKILQDAGATR
jgi:NAD(P)H-hydrate epimerase